MHIKLFSLLVILFIGCKTISVDEKSSKVISNKITLLDIGINEDLLLENYYVNNTLIKIEEPIKLQVNKNTFTKYSYKSYLKANTKQTKEIKVTYQDSSKVKPAYLSIKISDKIPVLETLNNAKSTSLKQYLSLESKAELVIKMSLVFNHSIQTKILQAEEVFLAAYGVNSKALHLYKQGKLLETIPFTEAVVFAYNTAGFCWKENKKRQLEIVDFVENSSCPPKTYKNSNTAKKKINHFKF